MTEHDHRLARLDRLAEMSGRWVACAMLAGMAGLSIFSLYNVAKGNFALGLGIPATFAFGMFVGWIFAGSE